MSTKAYSEPCQTLEMERFAKLVNGFRPLAIFAYNIHLRCLMEF